MSEHCCCIILDCRMRFDFHVVLLLIHSDSLVPSVRKHRPYKELIDNRRDAPCNDTRPTAGHCGDDPRHYAGLVLTRPTRQLDVQAVRQSVSQAMSTSIRLSVD